MEEPDFWNDPERSQELMKELKSKKDDVEIYRQLTSQMEDMELMIEMGYEENEIQMIGPVRAPVYKVNDIYRKILYIKSESYDILLKVRKSAQKREEENERYKNVNFQAAVQ